MEAKTKKLMIYITIGLFIIVAIWYFFIHKKEVDKSLNTSSNSNPGTNTPSKNTPVYTDDTLFLNKSPLMRDYRVKEIQKLYNKVAQKKDWPKIHEDGKFGDDTETAIERWTNKTSISLNGANKAFDNSILSIAANTSDKENSDSPPNSEDTNANWVDYLLWPWPSLFG